jgi:hypothetical protein
MKIADASFRSMAGYVGILRTVNDTMNSFLRECEAPKHDSWSENNFGDTEGEYKHAKFILKEIESWERQIIKELNDIDDSKKIDPLGMEEFLPSDVDDNLEGEKQNEGNSFKPLDVEIKLRKDSKRTFVDQTSEGLVSDNEGEEEIEGSYGNNEGNNGNGSGDGGYNLPATPGVNSQEKKRVPIKYIKTPYLNEDGKYRVIFTPLETHEDCELKIRRAGDDIMENVKIEKMFLIKNDLIEEKNKFDIIAGQKIELEVHLKDIKREALEVGCVVKTSFELSLSDVEI